MRLLSFCSYLLLLLSPSSAQQASTLSWVKAAGPLCIGTADSCTSAEDCTMNAMGPCVDATNGPSSYISSVMEGLALVDESNYLLGCADQNDCEYIGIVDPSGPGFRDGTPKGHEGGTTYAYNMAGNTFGNQPDTWGGYFGNAAAMNTGSANLRWNHVDVLFATGANSVQTARTNTNIGAPIGPMPLCIADVVSSTCTGERVWAPGSYLNAVFGYTYESYANEYLNEYQAVVPTGNKMGIRQAFTASNIVDLDVTFNSGMYTLDTLGNYDVTDITLTWPTGTLHFEFPTNYNHGDASVSGSSASASSVINTQAIKIKVSRKPGTTDTIYVDYLFNGLLEANQYLVYAMVITADFTSSPPPPSSIGWAFARDTSTSGGTCAGILTDCTNQETCTSTYIGPCESAESGASSYVATTVHGIGFVNEASYLACPDINECAEASMIGSTGPGYRDFSGGVVSGDSTYAYTMAGNLYGSDWGGYIGVASYLNTGGSTIRTSTSQTYVASLSDAYQVARGDSTIGAPRGPYTVCIADGTTGTCTGERSFAAGHFKFSIYGYTYESLPDYEYSAEYWNASILGQIPDPTTHLAVRTLVRTSGFDASNILFNGDSLTPSTVNTSDITDFTLTTPAGKIIYNFPTAYNYGPVAGAVDGSSVPMDLTGGGDIKIKVSIATSTSLYVDYLVPVSAALTVANNYFIYDPDISTAYSSTASDDDSGVSTGVIIGACAGGGAFLILIGVGIYFMLKKPRADTDSSPSKTCSTRGNGDVTV